MLKNIIRIVEGVSCVWETPGDLGERTQVEPERECRKKKKDQMEGARPGGGSNRQGGGQSHRVSFGKLG